jgi:hypothetical protein
MMGGARMSAGTITPSSTVSALWVLVALELGGITMLRRYFRKHHGG